jgi:hypothetical protein
MAKESLASDPPILELRGGTLEANSNITVNANGTDGMLIGGGQLVIFGSPGSKVITALDNKGSGINLPGFASITNLGGAKFVLGRNATSLSMGIESSMVMIGGLNLESNTTGLLADGAGSLLLAPNPANPSVGPNFSRRRISHARSFNGKHKSSPYVETSCPIVRQAEAIHMSEKSPFRGLRANRGGLTIRGSVARFPTVCRDRPPQDDLRARIELHVRGGCSHASSEASS